MHERADGADAHTIQTSADAYVWMCWFKYWRPMVSNVSLFQVAEVPTNLYDYKLP